MIIDTKPRDFNYVSHKQTYPLQLKGNMRRKARPASCNLEADTKQKCSDNYSKLQSRIVENYQDLKSVLPADYSNRKRRQSIRTYDKQKYINVSGAVYLMVKSNAQKDHPQKKHITDRSSHYGGYPDATHKQRRHFDQTQNYKSNENTIKPSRKHSNTLYRKIDNDLYSKLQTKENIVNSTVKIGKRNMFSQGVNLGYQQSKQPKMSLAKHNQIMGNDWNTQQMIRKNVRVDWNRSSFMLG